jgi:anti-sigma factor RsiW
MSKPIHRLRQELRAESCPARVLANVREEIARDRRPWTSAARVRAILLTAGLACLFTFSVVRWFSGESARQDPRSYSAEKLTPAQIVNETHLSLACIGSAFIEAGDRTETIILKRIKPRLFDGLEKAAKAISNTSSL